MKTTFYAELAWHLTDDDTRSFVKCYASGERT